MQGHQALNHIYKDLVSIVITQSTDKGLKRGVRKEGLRECVCACVGLLVGVYKLLCMCVGSSESVYI